MDNYIKLFDFNMEPLNIDDCKIKINKNKLVILGKKLFNQRFDDISYVLYKNIIFETKNPSINRNKLSYTLKKCEEHSDDFITLTIYIEDNNQININSENVAYRFKGDWFIFKSTDNLKPNKYQIDLTCEVLNQTKRQRISRNIKLLYSGNGVNYYLVNKGVSSVSGYSCLLEQLRTNNQSYLYNKFKNNFAYYINLALRIGYTTPGVNVIYDVNRQPDILVALLTKVQGSFEEVYLIDNKVTKKFINTKLNNYFSVFEKEHENEMNISSITSREISNAMQLLIIK